MTPSPFSTTLLSVQSANTVTVAMTSATPTQFTQGITYAVVRATLTVDSGIAQINQVTVQRIGTGADADVSTVTIYKQTTPGPLPLNLNVDQPLGSAAFVSGSAAVNISTTNLTAGTSTILFVAYGISPTGVPGDTLGARIGSSGALRMVSPTTSVSGSFPFATSTAPIVATVNTLSVTSRDATPGTLLQGATAQAVLRLDVYALPNPINWSSLAVKRIGSGNDSDIAAIRVYLDNGDAVLTSADAAVTNSFTLTNGAANVSFNSPQQVGASTATYFVAVDVAAGAYPGDTFGLQITTASFNVNSPNTVSTTTLPTSNSGTPTITQFPNVVTVSTLTTTPSSGANPGALNVAVMTLTLNANVSTAQLLSVKTDRSGSSADTDVSAVKLWYDYNGIGSFDASNLGQYKLVTLSTMTFGSSGTPGSLTLGFTSAQTLTTVGARYFLTVDVSTSAVPGHQIVVQSVDKTYYTVNAPNSVAATSFVASPLSVLAPPSQMYVLAYASAPATALQGASGVTALSLAAWMKSYTGALSSLNLVRTGASSDSDIARVKIVLDNGNGVFDPVGDTVLSTGVFINGAAAFSFSPVTITPSTQTLFVVYDFSPTATVGDTAGALIGSPGSFGLASPNSVSGQGFPIQSSNTVVFPTEDGVSFSGSDRAPGFLLQNSTNNVMLSLTLNTTANAVLLNSMVFTASGTAVDSDTAHLRIYQDVNGNGIIDAGDILVADASNPFLGGVAAVPMSSPQPIGTTPTSYLVAVDVANFAINAHTLGLVVASTGAVSVPAPNYVVNAGFPVASSVIPIHKIPDTLTVVSNSLLGTGVIQSLESPVARLQAVVSRQSEVWTQLTIAKSGNLADGMVNRVAVYRDANGDGIWQATDLLIGSATFTGGSASVVFSSAQTVGLSTQSYFVTYTINTNATVGATIGAAIASAGNFTVLSPDLVSSAHLPFQTPLAAVLDARTPTQPVVTLAAGRYSSSFDTINFSWTSGVLIGTITAAQYAVGTASGASNVVPYTAMSPVPGSLSIGGLFLGSGTTYYVSVKATSNSGYTSLAGASLGQLIDYVTPGQPQILSNLVDQSVVALSWTPATVGPSGLGGYLVEYRMAQSPTWFNAQTGASDGTLDFRPRDVIVSTTSLISASTAAITGLPGGTLFLRVSAVSNAGLVSTPSAIVRMQIGALSASALSAVESYPNPFDSRLGPATINYTLDAPGSASFDIYTIYGVKVRSFSAAGLAGTNSTTWDGSDDSGRKVSKGIYILDVSAGGGKATWKIGVIH
jgi:hypothetical protein